MEPGVRPPTARNQSHNSVVNSFIDTASVHSNTPKTASSMKPSPSVMDRTRAVSRPDVLPRFADKTASPARMASPVSSPKAQGDEQAVLARGPDLMSVGEYFSALKIVIGDLEQMYKGLNEGRGGAREQGVTDLGNSVEDAFTQLTNLLVKKVRDTMPRAFDPNTLVNSAPQPITTYYPALSSVKTLANGLVAIVEPKNPTPRTTEILTPLLGACIMELAIIRGEWLKKSLSGLAARIDEVDGSKWEGPNGEKVRLVMELWEAFTVASEAEADVAEMILPGDAGARLLVLTLPYGNGVGLSSMEQVTTTIKRNLSAQTMVLLDLYSALVNMQPRFETTMERVLKSEPSECKTALAAPISALRALALRSFPERLVDIRSPPRNTTPTTAIDDNTHSTLTYLEQLPTFGGLADTLLRASGKAERSWLMGMNQPPSSAKSADEEGGIASLYAADVLGTLLSALETRSKTMRKPISSSFLLNNVSHIRNTTSSFSSDLIGPGAEDMLNRHFREAKTAYLSEWVSLTQALQHTASARFNVGSSDKQSTKEAAASFFERLAELETTCRQHPLSRQDPDLRERVGSEVADLVGAAYKTFWTKAHAKGFDKCESWLFFLTQTSASRLTTSPAASRVYLDDMYTYTMRPDRPWGPCTPSMPAARRRYGPSSPPWPVRSRAQRRRRTPSSRRRPARRRCAPFPAAGPPRWQDAGGR